MVLVVVPVSTSLTVVPVILAVSISLSTVYIASSTVFVASSSVGISLTSTPILNPAKKKAVKVTLKHRTVGKGRHGPHSRILLTWSDSISS